MSFSAKDADNDKHSGTHCAHKYRGGWWWNSCGIVGLTTLHRSDGLKDRGTSHDSYIYWFPNKLTSVKMMVS